MRKLEVDTSALDTSTGSSHRGAPASFSSPKDSLDKLGRSLSGKSRFIFPGGDTRTSGAAGLDSVHEHQSSHYGGIRKPRPSGVNGSFGEEGGDALEVESTRIKFASGSREGGSVSLSNKGGLGIPVGSEMTSGSSLSTDIEILEQRNRARLRRLRAVETGGATTSESESILDQTLGEDSFASQPSMRPIEADQLDQLLRDYLSEEQSDGADVRAESTPTVVAPPGLGELASVETRWIG